MFAKIWQCRKCDQQVCLKVRLQLSLGKLSGLFTAVVKYFRPEDTVLCHYCLYSLVGLQIVYGTGTWKEADQNETLNVKFFDLPVHYINIAGCR